MSIGRTCPRCGVSCMDVNDHYKPFHVAGRCGVPCRPEEEDA